MQMKIKKSYGIICCRRHPVHGVQFILVKKPTTYHFNEFIGGRYSKSDDRHLKKLFNNMTYYEKMDIASTRFNLMWYRLYKHIPSDQGFTSDHYPLQELYLRRKSKFELSFMRDSGARLRKLMANTCNAETIWEIPKGRKQEHESAIQAAMREFTEETTIPMDNYKVLWRIPPYIETYSDFGVTYQNVYYYADAVGDWEPSIHFTDQQQVFEVQAIGWCTRNDILHMKLEKKTHDRLITLFEKAIKKYKRCKAH